MSAAPPVSVVVACHTENRWAGIVSAARSALDQQPGPAAVVVAVDHNPALAARLRRELPGVGVVENTSPVRGASATRNAGAAGVTTPLLAFLDDDETATPGWLAGLVAPFLDPAVAGTGGRYRPAWLSPRPGWFPDEFAWTVGGHHTGMPSTVTPVRNVWSGNMAVRTGDFRAVGGFRLGFGKVGGSSRPEDTDLCIRVAAVTGGSWLYLPHAVIDHEVTASRSTIGFFLRRCFAEGRGKVALARVIAADGTLRDERRYLTRTLPAGVLRHLAEVHPLRALAIIAGAGAAVAGAALETVTGRIASKGAPVERPA